MRSLEFWKPSAMNLSVSFAVLLAILASFTLTRCEGIRRHSGKGKASDETQTTSTTIPGNLTLLRCDKKIIHVTQTSGAIRSPNFPQGYETDQRCTWHVQVPRGFRIKVRFRKLFELEDSAGCRKDYIMLSMSRQFRNPLIYCGSARPSGIITAKNALWIRFHSDNATTGKGFYLSYMPIDENECKRPVCTFPSLCRNTVGSYACDCPDGYANRGRKDAVRCEDIDECKISNGRCDQKCINTEGSYYCLCRRGFKQAPDGRKCRDQNECSRNNGGCSHFCTNSRSAFRCTCPEGFALHSDKKTCYPEISFFHEQYTVDVTEDTRSNTVVAKVEATTFPLKHVITYTLLSENLNTPSLFTINSRTGEVSLTGQLERDKMQNFLLEVEASFRVPNTSESGTQYRSAKSYVLVNIRENDSSAALSFTHSSYFLNVPCNTTVDSTIYRVRTVDAGSQGSLRLRFRFQRKVEHFSISSNGRIRSQKSLAQFCNVKPPESFETSVIVRDADGIKRNAQAQLRIVITPPGLVKARTAGSLSLGATDTKDTMTRRQTFLSGQGIGQQGGAQGPVLRNHDN